MQKKQNLRKMNQNARMVFIIQLTLDFLKLLNKNYSITAAEENEVIRIQQIINNSFTGTSLQKQDELNNLHPPEKSEVIKKIEESLEDIRINKQSLYITKKEIDDSFNNLKVILESRNELSNILKDFNTSTKVILNEQEMLVKLNKSIDKIYTLYDSTTSILAFFDSSREEVVEKIRFMTDFEEIENGINFFTFNTSFVEAGDYLKTYNMLKKIAIARYFHYMSNTLQVFLNLFDGLPSEDKFMQFILNYVPNNMDMKYYNVPKKINKIKELQIFFENKSENDDDLKRTIETIKNNFIKQRGKLLKPFYEEVFVKIGEDFKTVNNNLSQIIKFTLCEIIYFANIFQARITDSTYILQHFISDLYDNLYNTLRPIIVSSDSLEDLLMLIESLSEYFGLLFLENEDKEIIIQFFKNLNKKFDPTEEDLNILLKHTGMIFEIIRVSKILIRPIIMKLVQDTQEKIFFRINLHLKTNFDELEADFPKISKYEETIGKNQKHFNLLHFYLRRMSVVLEILKNKLDQKVINELTIISIENFITILNNKILENRNQLTIEFQIYIIQQIILAIKILEEYQIEAIESDIEIDFYAITDIFKNNVIQSFFDFKDILVNSSPKISNRTRDFKKILYNNLLKSYKILINIVNEFVFKRDIMEVVYKIRNKEIIDEKYLNEKIKADVFSDFYTSFEKIILEIKSQIKIIDSAIAEKIVLMILENINNIIAQIRTETFKYEHLPINAILQSETVNHNLNSLKDSLFE
jgi:hypothetical protein